MPLVHNNLSNSTKTGRGGGQSPCWPERRLEQSVSRNLIAPTGLGFFLLFFFFKLKPNSNGQSLKEFKQRSDRCICITLKLLKAHCDWEEASRLKEDQVSMLRAMG